MVTRETWPQFWAALAGTTEQTVSGKSFNDIEAAVQEWLAEQQPDRKLQRAEEALDNELRWHRHDWRP